MTVSRPVKILLIASAAIAFIAASLGLARVLSARAAERTTLEQLIADEAAGRAPRVADAIGGCPRGSECAAKVEAMVGKVAAPEAPLKILQISQGTPVSPGGGTGVARIAWRTDGRLPVVQCVVVSRTGDVVSGFELRVLAVSKPIEQEGTCPDAGRISTAG